MTHIAYLPDLPYDEGDYVDDTYGYEPDYWAVDAEAEYYDGYLGAYQPIPSGHFRPDAISLVAVVMVMLVAFWLITGKSGLFESADGGNSAAAETASSSQAIPQTQPVQQALESAQASPQVNVVPTADTVIAPYENYILTQGPHGYSYGHMAIDISAGKGAAIKAPIQGTVTAFYYDEVGNTSLVIENERYQVLLLHGLYTVEVGQPIALGQVLGTESNQGNTRDMAGNSCRNRDCGYHTHLNIFDKQYGVNVNPLELLP